MVDKLTLYVNETIPIIVTDDDITKLANETVDYISKWTRPYNSNDIRGIAQHIFIGFFEDFCYNKLGCMTEEDLKKYYVEDEDESLIIYEIVDKIPVKIQ